MKKYILSGIFIYLGICVNAQVENPGFELGSLTPSGIHYNLEGWFFAFNPNGGQAVPSLDSVVKYSGNRSFKTFVTETGSPSNPWNIRLETASNSYHSFNKDDIVEFSFYARANKNGKEIAVKFRDSNNGNWVQQPKTLSTSFRKYTISQKIPESRTDYKLTFFLASDTGTFWIDDVSVSSFSGSVNTIPAKYHISPLGDDGNPGTIEAPFKTLDKASSVLDGNDTLFIHEGNYRGDLNVNYLKGNEANPIVITSWPGEQVVIDGTIEISDGWADEGNGMFSRIMDQDIWGLYYKDSMMMAARWPNASIYDHNFFNQKETYRDMSTQSELGLVHDAKPFNNEQSEYYEIPTDGSYGYIRPGYNNQSLAATGVNMEGAVAIMNSGSWLTWASAITSHEAGSDMFEYDSMFSASGSTRNSALKWTRPRVEQLTPTTTVIVDDLRKRIDKNHCHYYIEGLPCLDVPGEWWYIPETMTLFFMPPNGIDPNGESVKVKVKDYNLYGKVSEFLVIKDIDFFGTAFNFESSKAISIENCKFLFPGHSKRVLKDHDLPAICTFNNMNDVPTCHRLINCSFEYFDGNGVEFRKGGYNTIDNVLLHDFNFSCLGEGKALITSDYDTIRRVTLYNSGGSEGIDVNDGAVVEYNHLHHFGSLQHDGAGVQTFFTEAPVIYRYNWSHSTLKGGLRFDDGGGIPKPPPYGGQMSHNVSWTSRGFQIKGDSSLIDNNLLFNTRNGLELMVHERMNGINTNSITINNISDWILNNGWNRKHAPGYLSSNVEAKTDSVKNWVRDADNWDFRPLYEDYVYEKGEDHAWCTDGENPQGYCYNYLRLIQRLDSLPDIGPYEAGASNYWIPGFQFAHTSTPIPLDKGTSKAEFVDLMWLTGYMSTSNDVYFGSSESDVTNAGRGAEAFMGNQLTNIFYPGSLESGQTYFWRVDAIKGTKTIKGPVWSFTAGQDANPPAQKVSFQVYGKNGGNIYPLERTVVSMNSRSTFSDINGEATLKQIKPGSYNYQINRKGYNPKSKVLSISQDTVITDTLQITTYLVGILILDEDTSEPIGACAIELGGVILQTGVDGTAQFNNVGYDLYNISTEFEGYKPGLFDGIEIYSDTTLVFQLVREYLLMSVKVLNRVSDDPLYRAQINYNGWVKLTNASGEADLEKAIYGSQVYSITHSDYFDLLDSVWISKDTSLTISMTPKLASMSFEVSDSEGLKEGVAVEIDQRNASTNSEGVAIFQNQPARHEYIYAIEEEGYVPIHDTLWLETDTTVTVSLVLPISSAPGIFSSIQIYPNPAREHIYVNIPYKEAIIELVSIDGRVIVQKKGWFGPNLLDLTKVTAGVYYLGVGTRENWIQSKVIVVN